jgi:hypothetical protein
MIVLSDVPLLTLDTQGSLYGAFRRVGPGVCGDGAIFVGMGFDGAVLSDCGNGAVIDMMPSGAVLYGGAQGAMIPVDIAGDEYI